MGVRQRLRRGKARQSGAVAIWVAAALVAMVTAVFLAIDTGRLYFTQRQLQKLANLAAVAGTQVASGCSGSNANGTAGSLDDVTNLVSQFLISNGGAAAASYLTGANGAPPVELGTMVHQNNLLVFAPLSESDSRIDSVRVNLSEPQPTPFVSFLTGGGTLTASATATQPLGGSFTVGSTLLKESGGFANQVLSGLLCAPSDKTCQDNVIALNLVSSDSGLANVSVNASQIATAAGVSVKDLSDPLTLSTQTVVLSSFLNNLEGALSGTVNSSVTGLLSNLASAASGNSASIPLDTLIGALTPTSGNVPVVDLLDLLTALGAASHEGADGTVQPIALPINVSVPNTLIISVYLRILQPPQSSLPRNLLSGVGRPGVAKASTSQIRIEIRMQLGPTIVSLLQTASSAFALLGVQVLPDGINLGVDIDVAQAIASLDSVTCPASSINGGAPVAGLSVSTAIANVSVGTFTGTPSASNDPALNTSQTGITLLSVPGLGSLTFNLSTVSVGQTPVPYTLKEVTQFQRQQVDGEYLVGVPPIYIAQGSTAPAVADNPQTVGSPVNADIELQLGGSGLIGELNSTLLSALNSVVALVDSLSTSLVNPLLEGLGIQLGTATVTMDAVQIARPAKVATCMPNGAGTNACQQASAPPASN